MRYLPTGGAALRQQNAAVVVGVLREQRGAVTVSELAARTGLSRPTVEAVTAELAAAGVLRVSEATSTGVRGGRPARTVGFDAEAGCVAGIDVGTRRVRVVVTDLAGRVLQRTTDRLPPGPVGAGDRLALVRSAVAGALHSQGRGVRDLRGAALAVPGILGPDESIGQSLAVPDWTGIRIGRELGRGWHCPVVLQNDIKTAALAEQRLGGPDRADDLVYLQLGHRVSLALVIDGRIRQGHHRLAGELGTLRGMRWTTGSRRGQLRWQSAPTGREVFAAAAAGRPDALAEVEAFCAEIAPTVATVLLAVDPALVVVGGGLSRAGATLLDPLRAAVHRLYTTSDRPVFSGSDLGGDAAVLGALGLAFEHASERINGLAGVPAPWSHWSPSTTPSTPVPVPAPQATRQREAAR